MADETAKKCWACGGVMTFRRDSEGRPFFQCTNDFCKATDTDLPKSPEEKSLVGRVAKKKG